MNPDRLCVSTHISSRSYDCLAPRYTPLLNSLPSTSSPPLPQPINPPRHSISTKATPSHLIIARKNTHNKFINHRSNIHLNPKQITLSYTSSTAPPIPPPKISSSPHALQTSPPPLPAHQPHHTHHTKLSKRTPIPSHPIPSHPSNPIPTPHLTPPQVNLSIHPSTYPSRSKYTAQTPLNEQKSLKYKVIYQECRIDYLIWDVGSLFKV